MAPTRPAPSRTARPPPPSAPRSSSDSPRPRWSAPASPARRSRRTRHRPADVVVAPVAVGEIFIACARGFREMHEVGFIERMPTMVAAQATRANPIARAWSDGGRLQPQKIGYTVAEGLAAGNPGRKGEWVLHLLREHGGLAGHAEDDEILAAQRLLARTEGIWA